MTVVYYVNAAAFLVDPAVADIGAGAAVALSLALLVVGLLLYNALCVIDVAESRFALIGSGAILLLCWGLSYLFSGRGMFMQVGAMLGTIMAANVFFTIIPSQKQLVAAKLDGEELPNSTTRRDATSRRLAISTESRSPTADRYR